MSTFCQLLTFDLIIKRKILWFPHFYTYICNLDPSFTCFVLSFHLIRSLSLILSPSSASSGSSVLFLWASVHWNLTQIPQCTCLLALPAAFSLPNDLPSFKPLTANGQAFCSPPWRPTTCQVTVATTAEGTDPWQLTLILPLVWRVWCVTFIPDFSLKGFMHSNISFINRRCICHSTQWRTPVHRGERRKLSNTE